MQITQSIDLLFALNPDLYFGMPRNPKGVIPPNLVKYAFNPVNARKHQEKGLAVRRVNSLRGLSAIKRYVDGRISELSVRVDAVNALISRPELIPPMSTPSGTYPPHKPSYEVMHDTPEVQAPARTIGGEPEPE